MWSFGPGPKPCRWGNSFAPRKKKNRGPAGWDIPWGQQHLFGGIFVIVTVQIELYGCSARASIR